MLLSITPTRAAPARVLHAPRAVQVRADTHVSTTLDRRLSVAMGSNHPKYESYNQLERHKYFNSQPIPVGKKKENKAIEILSKKHALDLTVNQA